MSNPNSHHNPNPNSNEPQTVSALIAPIDQLNILSKVEVAKLLDSSKSGLYKLFRSCALAVLNTGNDTDNGKELLERYKDFDISIVQQGRAIKLGVKNAAANAFVHGKMIKGISVR